MTNSDRFELPMFPIGSTVFPNQVVPLHVFEERYRQLLRDLLGTGPDAASSGATFGIVLIERGHEVGGDDDRVSVATRVEILQAEELDDGRWAVVTVGMERMNVHEWLEDDPYPRAIVSRRAVSDTGGSSLTDLEALLMETLELAASQAGMQMPQDFGLSNNPQQRLDQFSALAPLNEFDRQRVLEAETTSHQITLLTEALEGKRLLLRGVQGEHGA